MTPLTDRDAAEMVRGIRGYRLLQGYRGHPAADVAAIEEVLLRVSRLVEEVPEIRELDLNPIFALPPGQGAGSSTPAFAWRRIHDPSRWRAAARQVCGAVTPYLTLTQRNPQGFQLCRPFLVWSDSCSPLS